MPSCSQPAAWRTLKGVLPPTTPSTRTSPQTLYHSSGMNERNFAEKWNCFIFDFHFVKLAKNNFRHLARCKMLYFVIWRNSRRNSFVISLSLESVKLVYMGDPRICTLNSGWPFLKREISCFPGFFAKSTFIETWTN